MHRAKLSSSELQNTADDHPYPKLVMVWASGKDACKCPPQTSLRMYFGKISPRGVLWDCL